MTEYRVINDGCFIEGREMIADDKLPYAVLNAVLGGEVKKIITNDKDFIIAHTAKVFPTWIWAPDSYPEEKLEDIYQIMLKEFAPITEYRINAKYEIVSCILKRLKEDGYENARITINIAAYDCPVPKEPEKKVDGYLQQLSHDDFELAVKLIREASLAIGDRIFTEEESVEAAKEQLDRQVIYVWRNASGKAVSFCDRLEDNNYVKISQVYTPEEERGKGYAAQMIYELCCETVKDGKLPMLYADADYASSNRCYQKIGFVLKGKIATLGFV